MNKAVKFLFIAVALFSIYHLIRDLSTNMGIHNYIVDLGHREHLWCRKLYSWVCPWITVPPEVFAIVASFIVLRRNKIGVLGALVLVQIPIWAIFIFVIP